MLHLEGMGLMGSLTAQLLHAHDIPFTWHDTETKLCSWRACTGVAYPSGDVPDVDQLMQWHECMRYQRQPVLQMTSGDRFASAIVPFLEAARWCYYSTHPPHRGRKHVKEIGRSGGVHVSSAETMHINAQAFVASTQAQFAETRQHVTMSPAVALLQGREVPITKYIVTHGFTEETLFRWSWGWSRKVRLTLGPELSALTRPLRPCLYMRDGFTLDYLYPVPGEPDWWYAGTALITQKEPRESSDPTRVYANWLMRMIAKSGGAFLVKEHQQIIQGWRPIPHAHHGIMIGDERRNTWFIRPQYGSGFRHWWLVRDELYKRIIHRAA